MLTPAYCPTCRLLVIVACACPTDETPRIRTWTERESDDR